MAEFIEQEEPWLQELVPVSQQVVPYVLTWESELVQGSQLEALFLVVMLRDGGVLGALPLGVISDQQLGDVSQSLEEGQLIGNFSVMTTPGVRREGDVWLPVDQEVMALVVDFDQAITGYLREWDPAEQGLFGFVSEDERIFPQPQELVAKALSWMMETDLLAPAGRYSAEEVTAQSEGPSPVAPKARAKAKALSGQGGDMPSGKAPRPKRPTTTSLAQSLDVVMETLPKLASQLQMIADRQGALEQKVVAHSSVPTMLSQPLSSTIVVPKVPMVAEAAKMLSPPPKTYLGTSKAKAMAAVPLAATSAPDHVQELEKEMRVGETISLAQPLMVQSTALQSLVAQMAGAADPLVDLSSSSSTSTKGSIGRAKLQAELASNKGIFFDAVLRSMARRMSPTMASSQMSHQALMMAGVCGTKYLERFGGYGKQKDLGLLQFQIMTAMDYMQMENFQGAKDTLALISVMIEQAVLDGGRFEIAQLLTLQEDIPAAVYTNRQLSSVSKAKAFAPLADQRWITVALAFLKELDTISSKRTELMPMSSASSAHAQDGGEGAKTSKQPKKKSKGKGKGSSQSLQEEEA